MKKNRVMRPPTADTLANIALMYLGRYAASELSLRRVLQNRIRRAGMRIPEFAQDAEKQAQLRVAIESIIAKHKKTGVINDKAYAETKINSLRRSGRSARAIQQKLSHAGVNKDIIENVLAAHEDGLSADEAEIKAARAWARRRKLGPFRTGVADLARQRKDLAVLARAGFTLAVARRVLEQTSMEDDDIF